MPNNSKLLLQSAVIESSSFHQVKIHSLVLCAPSY